MPLGHPLNFPFINSPFFGIHLFFFFSLVFSILLFCSSSLCLCNWFSLLSPLYVLIFISTPSAQFLPLFIVTTHTQTPDIADHFPIANLHLHQYLSSHSRSLPISADLGLLGIFGYSEIHKPMHRTNGTWASYRLFSRPPAL